MPGEIEDLSTDSLTLSSLLNSDYRFEVPDYQRQYAWEKDQINQLWEDIQSIENEGTHFFGSIVLIDKGAGHDPSVYEVVDGQQRLSTVIIILAVIRQKYLSEGKKGRAEAIKNDYLWEYDSEREEYQNLKLNNLDNDDFNKILDSNYPDENSRLYDVVRFYEKKIDQLSISKTVTLEEKITDSLSVVQITTSDQDSAQLIFRTLNDRGKDLSQVDLMKNSLLEKAEREELNYTNIRDDWEETISTLRYRIQNPEKFFIHYMMSSPKVNISDSISARTAHAYFKDILEGEYGEIPVSELITDMRSKSDLYRNIVNNNVHIFAPEANNRINILLSELSEFGTTQERTLFLFLFSELDSPTEIIRGLRIIESYNVRQTLVEGKSGSAIDKMYASICNEMQDTDAPIEYIQRKLQNEAPTDTEFRASILSREYKRSGRTFYLLCKFEKRYFSSTSDTTRIEADVEHIAPRSAFTAKKYSKWAEYFSMGKSDFEQKKNKLGNLTLLEERLNISAGIDPFTEKQEHYESSDFEMSNALCRFDEWSKSAIQTRTKELADNAPQTWGFDF
jgi:uncharacterized protein with ParB-like and HNH nuclease domain